MNAALLTLFFFSLTAVFASRSTRLLGPLEANAARLILAFLILGLWTQSLGQALWPAASGPWFLLGGVAGFGLGGLSMFQALARLGAVLSTLGVQCGTAVLALFIEAVWLGTLPSLQACLACSLVLLGVGVGLAPSNWPRLSAGLWREGMMWTLLASLGQAFGAVASRQAFQVARTNLETVHLPQAALVRIAGGLCIGLLVWQVARKVGTLPRTSPEKRRASLPWVLANSLTGPVLGVTCYQWALRGWPSALVQSVVALAPLLTVPFAAWFEKAEQRWPQPRYYAGCLLALAGLGLLAGA